MARYLDDQATVDAINGHLREICPTLFSADDAVYAKVSLQILLFARHVEFCLIFAEISGDLSNINQSINESVKVSSN